MENREWKEPMLGNLIIPALLQARDRLRCTESGIHFRGE
jgi:hypothetical protein